MPETAGQRRRKVVILFTTSLGLMTATGALAAAWAAPNTQVIRPPQSATATTPKTKPAATRPHPAVGVKRVPVRPTTARRHGAAAPDPVAANEAKPFAIDPARPLDEQLAAVGVSRVDAQAAARAVTSALKGVPLAIGTTGRAALVAGGAQGSARLLQSLQIFGANGIVADVERAANGAFVGKPVASATSATEVVRGANRESEPPTTEDDPRAWAPGQGPSARIAGTFRGVTPAGVGLRRVSASGDANVALTRAGIDADTARTVAGALAAVAPASLDRRSANIELVNGPAADGQVRLLTATIYDSRSRAQVWWFAPKGQPAGYFDERGNRIGDSGMTLPIAGSHISSPFGTRRWGRWAAFHNGIDIAGQFGTPIIAAADGTVDYVGWYYNYGKTVRIVHSDTLATSYSHMSSFVRGVSPGTHVHKGQVIGYVGSTGRSTGPHLHFCVIVNGHFINPAPYVAGGGGHLTGQDLVAFRDWQRTTASMARNVQPARSPSSENDGYNRL